MTEPLLTLRRAIAADAAPLAAFAARTFFETFGPDNDPEHMAAHLATAYSSSKQEEELADPAIVTLVLEAGTALAGYAVVRQQEPPPAVVDRTSVELRRFYVDRPWHGSGAARRLLAAVHEAAVELGGTGLWLSVWERNPRAIAFYTKCGFADVGSVDFWVGPDRQTDRLMVAPLGPP